MSAEGNMVMGGVICVAGLLVTIATAAGGDTIILAYGAIVGGAVQFVAGGVAMAREKPPEGGDPSGIAHRPRQISGQISADDYPASAMRAGEEGSVTVAFNVGRNGRVGDAELASSSGSRALDEATCRLIAERFAYEPAKDINMNPLAARHQQTIHWRLPEE